MIPLGEVHRKILRAVYELREDAAFPKDGFSQRQIAEKAGISQGTVSKNRAYLTMSLGLLYETVGKKLAISDGISPSDWSNTDPMQGFPTPAQVMRGGEPDRDPSPLSNPRNGGITESPDETSHRNGKKGDSNTGITQESPNGMPPSYALKPRESVTMDELRECRRRLPELTDEAPPSCAEEAPRTGYGKPAYHKRPPGPTHPADDEINDPAEYDKLDEFQQDTLLYWIAQALEPTSPICSSYWLKHEFEHSTAGFYITNGAFKGAMSAAGYEAVEDDGINSFYACRVVKQL